MSNVIGIHHAGLVVPDIEAAKSFYKDFAGYRVVGERRWDAGSTLSQVVGIEQSAAKFCMLQGDYGFLELFEYEEPATSANPSRRNANDLGIRHVCFQVRDVDQALAQVVALGGTKTHDPITNERGVRAVYCRDPFGNLLELIAPAGPLPGLEELNAE